MISYDNTHYNKSSTVENYDLCRHIPASVLDKFSTTIIGSATESSGNTEASILEEGAGNGRILIPTIRESMLQRRNDQFYAIDKSRPMIKDLERRLSLEEKARCRLDLGDIQEKLPYEDSSLDCIYTFAVYHILNEPEKALDEMVKKLKPTGCFIFGKEFTQVFHGTEGRIEPEDSEDLRGVRLIPLIKDFFHEYHRCRERHSVPFTSSKVLYSNPSLILKHLKSLGFHYTAVKGEELSYKKPHTLRQMLEAFRLKNITTFGSDIPDSIRSEMHAELLGWCKKNNHSLDENMDVPASITLYLFSRR